MAQQTFSLEELKMIVNREIGRFRKGAVEEANKLLRERDTEILSLKDALANSMKTESRLSRELQDTKIKCKKLESDYEVLLKENMSFCQLKAEQLPNYMPSQFRVKQHPDCQHCSYLKIRTGHLSSKLEKMRSKLEDELIVLDAAEAFNKKLEHQGEALSDYIKELENLVKPYFEDFENWKTNTLGDILIAKDLTGTKEQLTAELLDLQDQITAADEKLKKTMPYREYILVKETREKLQAMCSDLENQIAAANKPHSTFVFDVVKSGIMTPQEQNTAVLLGLRKDSSLREAVSILCEASIYHKDRKLFENVRDLVSKRPNIKTKRCLVRAREYLARRYWIDHNGEVTATSDYATEGVTPVPENNNEIECKEISTSDKQPEGHSRSEVMTNLQLLYDIRDKINLTLNHKVMKFIETDITASLEFSRLRNELMKAHTETVEMYKDPDKYPPNSELPLKKKLVEIIDILNRYNFGFKQETFESMMNKIKDMTLMDYCMTANFRNDNESDDTDNNYSYDPADYSDTEGNE